MSVRDTCPAAGDAFAGPAVPLRRTAGRPSGLGVWRCRDLVGHTAGSAPRQVPAVLANPAGHQEILSGGVRGLPVV
jgi:hypothetical protein